MTCKLTALFLTALTLSADPVTMYPHVRGTHEMIAAGNPYQVEAGWRILMQGGNAIDAGVAAILAATVTEQSRVGLGGEVPILIKPKGAPPVAISGIGVAPSGATADYYRQRTREIWEMPNRMAPIPSLGVRATITPGLLDGLLLSLQRFGTKSFAEVAQPAIELADGFPIGEEYSAFLKQYAEILAVWPSSAQFFLPGGAPPVLGSIFHSTDLAKTFRELAAAEKKGKGKREQKVQAVRNYFYRGPIADKINRYVQAEHGLLSARDLAAYSAEVDQPRSTQYRGYTVLKPGFWTQGPVMLEALNILDGYDLRSMGHNSPAYIHTVVEAIKLAFADRDQFYGDPKFSRIPEDTLLSKEYAATRRQLIDPQAASTEHRPGTFPTGAPLPVKPEAVPGFAHDTTCVNVVDRFGNAFSATPSGAWLPSVIVPGTGIPLSTRGESFVLTAGHPNEIQPGKRPRVTLSPTMVLKDGEPFLALSTPGGDNQDQALLQVLLNIIEFGMNPQEAVEAPRFQSEHFYASFGNHEFNPNRLNMEGRFDKKTADALRALGHNVQVNSNWSNPSAPTVIQTDRGILQGGADPRRARFLMGR